MNESSITTLPRSPEEDRRRRMRQYFISMLIRVACIACLPFLHGWWLVIPAVGAIVIPYFAMLFANQPGTAEDGYRESPGGIVRSANGTAYATADPAATPSAAATDFEGDAPAGGDADAASAPTPAYEADWVVYETRATPNAGASQPGAPEAPTTESPTTATTEPA
ncbi:DUF3099 domain-containing protein [Mycetocola tolaasinivorans]|nr:DUF3099 domain-containing protein [Mycetocola tolaasinivorans]